MVIKVVFHTALVFLAQNCCSEIFPFVTLKLIWLSKRQLIEVLKHLYYTFHATRAAGDVGSSVSFLVIDQAHQEY